MLWDTSALLSALNEAERSHERLKNLLTQSDSHGGSLLLRPELTGALLRRRLSAALQAFEPEWRRFSLVPLDEDQASFADRLVRRHRLKGPDAVHLAAALTILKSLPRRKSIFVTADRDQARAARAEGMRVVDL